MKEKQNIRFALSKTNRKDRLFLFITFLLASLLLSLLVYFKVSFFNSFLVLLSVGACLCGFFYKMNKRREELISFSSSGIFFSKKKEKIFLPWFSLEDSDPFFFDTENKLWKVRLKGHLPGLDFVVYEFEHNPEQKREPSFELEENCFSFSVPSLFFEFWEDKQKKILELYLENKEQPMNRGACIDLQEKALFERSCIINPNLELSFPGFCPFSGLEVNDWKSIKLVNSKALLNFRVSKEGFERQERLRKWRRFALVCFPFIFNLFSLTYFLFFSESTSISSFQIFLSCSLSLFVLSFLFLLTEGSSLRIEELKSGNLKLSFIDEDYFQAFLEMNLKRKESFHPFLDV
jgi:hypothetical protein